MKNMNINDAIKLSKKLNSAESVYTVMEDNQGKFVLVTQEQELVDNKIQNEFDALVFKVEHPLAPRGWRKWASKKGKEF